MIFHGLSPEQLFGAFPEPVLLYAQGYALYLNPAAAAIFPGVGPGGVVPGLLEGTETEGPLLFLTQVGETDWRVSIQSTPTGWLAIFRRILGDESLPRSDRLALQLRQQTAGLSAALQHLIPARIKSEEAYKQYLARANQGVHRLMRITDHLSFLEAPPLFRPVPLDLAGLCRETAAELGDVCRDTGWQFVYETELVGLLTTGDEAILRRMLMSLLGNAAKAAAGGRFGLKLTKLKARAVLTVWDNGPGISGEDMAALFGEAANEVGLDPTRGAGLGLRSARKAATLHGGTLMLESRVGEGFRAIVSLPIRAPEAGIPVRAKQSAYVSEHFSEIRMELSDVLPLSFFELEKD